MRRLFHPLFQAVKKLHDHKIVHCDLRPENLVFRDAEQTELVIVDFGLAYQLQWGNEVPYVRPMLARDKWYYPPEVKGVGQYEILPSIDVYCLGATLFFLLFDFEASSFREGVSPEVKDLISLMRKSKLSERITLKQALRHQWWSMPAATLHGLNLAVNTKHSNPDIKRRAFEELAMIETGRMHVQHFDKMKISPKVYQLKKSLNEIKSDILIKLAIELKGVKKRHDFVAPSSHFVSLNSTEFYDVMHAAGLPFISSAAVFENCDLDGNRAVDYREITLLLNSLGIFSTKQILQHFCFNLLDVDSSGSISKTELLAALGGMIFVTDDHVDHTVSTSEAMTVTGPQESCIVDRVGEPEIKLRRVRSYDATEDAVLRIMTVLGVNENDEVPLETFLESALTAAASVDGPAKLCYDFLFGMLERTESHP